MTKTWNEVYFPAIEAGFHQIVLSAEENALTTIREEKSAPESDFERLCFATLSELLSYSTDEAEKAYFEKVGIRY